MEIAGNASDGEGNLSAIDVAIRCDSGYWNGLEFTPVESWLSANGLDAWSLDVSDVSFENGVIYTVYSKAKDRAGNSESSPDSTKFRVDTHPPQIAISCPSDGSELNVLPPVSGTSSDSVSGVVIVEASLQRDVDGKYWNGSSWDSSSFWHPADGDSTWEVELAATIEDNHTYCLAARSIDGAGNLTSVCTGFFVDLSAPVVEIVEPEDPYLSALDLIAGTASDSGTIELVEVAVFDTNSLYWSGSGFEEGTSWLQATGTGSWELSSSEIAFRDSSYYTISVRALDLAGNRSTPVSRPVVFDTTAPGAPLQVIIGPGWKGRDAFDVDWISPDDFSGIEHGIYVKEHECPSHPLDGEWLKGKPSDMEASSEGEVPLYFWLRDRSSNSGFRSPAVVIAMVDTSGPAFGELEYFPEELTASDSEGLDVIIQVSDSLSGLDPGSVALSHRLGTGMFCDPQAMTQVGEGSFSAHIPAPPGGWGEIEGQDVAFLFSAADSVGNGSKSCTTSIWILPANSPPVVTSLEPLEGAFSGAVSLSAASHDSDGVVDRILYEYSVSDPGSGAVWNYIGVDMTPGTPYIWTTDFSAPAVWLSASAFDGVGWSLEPLIAGPIMIDNDPPITSDDIPSAWQSVPFLIHLVADDGTGIGTADSGGTFYSFDCLWWVEGDTLPIVAEGVFDLWYYSIDKLGNREETTKAGQPARLDTTSPILTSVWPSEDVTDSPSDTLWIWASSTDLVSGIGLMEAAWGFGDITEFVEMSHVSGDTWSVKVPTPAGGWKSHAGRTFAYQVKAYDLAGNADTSAVIYDHVEETNSPPDEFSLISPECGVSGVEACPLLEWESSCDPDSGDTVSYDVLLWPEGVTDTLTRNAVEDTFLLWDESLEDGTYYWTVIAVDNHGAPTPAGGGVPSHFTVGQTDVVLTLLQAEWSGECVELSWWLFSDGEPYRLDVFRHVGIAEESDWDDGRWQRLEGEIVAEPMGRFVFADCDVEPERTLSYCVVVSDEDGAYMFGPVDAAVSGYSTVSRMSAGPCHPNPFNPRTTLKLEIPAPGALVEVSVYSSDGRLLTTLLDDRLPEGVHGIEWDGTDDRGVELPSGVYYYRVISEIGSASGRMVLIR
jgi:hypothetical protein